jgi:hypothetical protein
MHSSSLGSLTFVRAGITVTGITGGARRYLPNLQRNQKKLLAKRFLATAS